MLAFLKQMFKIGLSKTGEELVKSKRYSWRLKKEVSNLGLNVIYCSRDTTDKKSTVVSSGFCDPQNKCHFSKLETKLRLCMFQLGEEPHYIVLVCVLVRESVSMGLLVMESRVTDTSKSTETNEITQRCFSDRSIPFKLMHAFVLLCTLILCLPEGGVGIIITF